MLNGYIYDGLRSPFGRLAGVLAGIRTDDLGAQVVRALVARSNLPVERIEDLILGNVCQSGEDSRNVARFVGLLAGVPLEAGGLPSTGSAGPGWPPPSTRPARSRSAKPISLSRAVRKA